MSITFYPSVPRPGQPYVAAEPEFGTWRPDYDAWQLGRLKWNWITVHDGSLSGNSPSEVNTSPAAGELYEEQMANLAVAISDSVVNESCGCHFHVDVRDLPHSQIYNLILAAGYLSPYLVKCVPGHRRTGRYAQWTNIQLACTVLPLEDYEAIGYAMAGSDSSRAADSPADQWERARNNKYGDSRYRAFNFRSFGRFGTVELRFPPGLTREADFIGWGRVAAEFKTEFSRLTPEMQTEIAGCDIYALYDLSLAGGLGNLEAETISTKFAEALFSKTTQTFLAQKRRQDRKRS